MANQDLTIDQFPAASALTGAEDLPLMQLQGGALKTVKSTPAAVAGLTNLSNIAGTLPVNKGGTGTTSPSLVQGTNITITGTWPDQTINAVGTGTSALGHQNLSIKSANFATTVAQATLVKNYQFGSAVAPGPGITTITNLTDLANNFNPFEDFTELTTINSEIERYQPFNSINHAFTPSNLILQGVNPNNDWQVTNITQCGGFTSGSATPIANLGLSDTSTVQLGQIASVQGGGIGGTYYITALVPNTSVTLTTLGGSPGTQTSVGLIFWQPVVGVALSQACPVGATTMTFAALPSFVKIGMQIAWFNVPITGLIYNRDQDYRVTNIAGNVVTFSPPRGNVANAGVGTITWFQPAVTSGQIWSQFQYDLTNPQNFFAIQADLTLFPNWTAIRTSNLGPSGQWSLATFNALPTNTILGAWPAFWSYSADDGNSTAETSSAAEIDMVELQVCGTQDITCMNTGAVTYSGAATIMQKTDSGWSTALGFGISSKTDGTNFIGRNLYQYILTNGMEYRFFNGVLYKVKQLQWTSQHPTQFSVGLALGAVNIAASQNTLFPNNPTSFPLMQVAINNIKLWYQPA